MRSAVLGTRGIWILAAAVALPQHVLPAADVLIVHYHRFDGEYDAATLWTWDEHLKRAPERNELSPVGKDDFGAIFHVDTSLYGKPGDKIGLLPRLHRDWQHKDGPDRFWDPAMGVKVYIVQGRPEVDASPPDVSPRIADAAIDGDRTITLRFTHRMPVEVMTHAEVLTAQRTTVPIASVKPSHDAGGRSDRFTLTAAEPLRDRLKTDHYALRITGFEEVPLRMGRVLRELAPRDSRLGATYAPEETTFRVFAPTATKLNVIMADGIEGDEGAREHPMTRDDDGVWSVAIDGDVEGRFYAFKLDGRGLDSTREVTDPYATCTQGRHARSLIVDLDKTDPPGFREHVYEPPASPADAVIYEMHVRDFTIAANSGVTHKGRYLGLAEPNTHLPDDETVTTGLDHLSELGVTHVQLLPVQDFDNDECDTATYNWGYMPVHFNAPDGGYAATPRGPAKIRELKTAIQALHERGIGVILDVVYNHTAGGASFESLVPGYYFRVTDDGRFSNGSGCGNEFQSEWPMARKFILDSVRFWVEEYRVDGFRFDLMGLIDLDTMKRIREELSAIRPGILVYGEPWTAGPTPLSPITDKSRVRGTGIGAFNDHVRDAIKGDRDGGAPGFIQTGDRRDAVVKGLAGAIYDWAIDPVDAVHYFAAHDNLTAYDKLLQSVPDAPPAVKNRMMCFAHLILLTSQGTIFLHGGQELCRTKHGNPNSYNAPDAVNQIDWSWKRENRDVFDYVRGLIRLRNAHPVFRLRTRADVERRIRFDEPPTDRCIVYVLDGGGLDGEPAAQIRVLLNGDSTPVRFTLPAGEWSMFVDADRAGIEALTTVTNHVTLPPHSGMVLVK